MRRFGLLAGVVLCVLNTPVEAGENSDLDFLPPDLGASASERVGTGGGAFGAQHERVYLENAMSLRGTRSGLVVQPPATASTPNWQDRTSLDYRGDWRLTEGLSATLSDRMNLMFQSNVDVPSRGNLRNDMREAFLTWEPATGSTYLEAGRINVRNGVALGFNPVDFFKTNTMVDQVSQDPSVIRENRLGTVMVRTERIFDGGSASVAFAPRLADADRIDDPYQPSLSPQLGRTNANNRLLLTVSPELGGDLSPQMLAYHEDGATKFGLSLAHGVSDSTVVYSEWAGGRSRGLDAEAERFGISSGSLPATVAATSLFPAKAGESFKHDLAIGVSWTGAPKVTINLEYHYHGAGLSRADWRNWFAVGSQASPVLPLSQILWYPRAYASVMETPVTRHQAFARAVWPDAFARGLELSAFTFVNLYDCSTMTQVSASYHLSDTWTAEALIGATRGGVRSEYGSQGQAAGYALRLVSYF